jgi:hypothetical protein
MSKSLNSTDALASETCRPEPAKAICGSDLHTADLLAGWRRRRFGMPEQIIDYSCVMIHTRFQLSEYKTMTRFGLVLLSAVSAAPAQAEQFSIKCIWNPAPSITFDEESKRVIWEVPRAMSHKGVIDSETEDEIRFHLTIGPLRSDRIWNRKTGALPAESPNDRTYENHCFKSDLRPVMSTYDEMLPY